MEGFANDFLRAEKKQSRELMGKYMYEVRWFLEKREGIPQKYKDKLKELVEKYDEESSTWHII